MPSTFHLLAAALLLVGPALAQTGVPAPMPERPSAGVPDTRVPERLAPPESRTGRDASPPGVISPGVDQDTGMAVTPPPSTGTTPVIPPPGTPGGAPGLQPR